MEQLEITGVIWKDNIKTHLKLTILEFCILFIRLIVMTFKHMTFSSATMRYLPWETTCFRNSHNKSRIE